MSNLDTVRNMVRSDRRLTVRSISEDFSVSCSTVHIILTQDLGMSNVSAHWVPRLLKDNEEEWLVACLSEFPRQFQLD